MHISHYPTHNVFRIVEFLEKILSQITEFQENVFKIRFKIILKANNFYCLEKKPHSFQLIYSIFSYSLNL